MKPNLESPTEPGPCTIALRRAEAAYDAAEAAWDADETDGEASGTTAALNAADAALDAAKIALAESDEAREFRLRWLDGSGVEETITASSMDEAEETARDLALGGTYDEVEETLWVRVRVEDVDGSESTVTVEIEPDEPDCTEDDHDWCSDHEIVGGIAENPGVWGHGGGVKIVEACRNCGCARITDTWAQDRSTGRQGLTSVSYEPGRFADVLAALEEERRAEEDDNTDDGET